MSDRLLISNDFNGGTVEHFDVRSFSPAVGDFTSDVTGQVILVATEDGRVDSAILAAVENGADGTDALNLELDVLINAVSVFTTKPKLDKAAGTGSKSTVATATGITVGVVDEEANVFEPGDIITVTLNITRTTPETEMASPTAAVKFVYSRPDAPNVSLSS